MAYSSLSSEILLQLALTSSKFLKFLDETNIIGINKFVGSGIPFNIKKYIINIAEDFSPCVSLIKDPIPTRDILGIWLGSISGSVIVLLEFDWVGEVISEFSEGEQTILQM